MESDKNKDLKEKMASGLLQLKKTGKKDEPAEWKSERIRAERRARLAEMKSKEGGKKPIRARAGWGRVVAIVVAAVLLLGVVGWALMRFGVPQRTLTALSVDDRNVTVSEMNMMMGLHAMNVFQMGLMYVPENQAMLKGTPQGSDHSYLDILADSAISELRMNKAIEAKLNAEGFTLSETAKAALDQQVAGLPAQFEQAAKQSNVTLPVFLESSFGPGAKMADLEAYLRESFTANEYVTSHFDAIKPTVEERETYYEANKDKLDMVNYYVAEFKASFPAEADEAAKQAARDGAKALAEQMLDKLEGATNFYDLAVEMTADTAAKKALERNPASVHHQFATFNDPETPAALGTWLFDAARAEGEKAVVPGTDASYVVLFESRSRAELMPYTVRHILIKADRTAATDEELSKAKTKAEDILKQYEDGDKTEAAFGELAKTNSEDSNAAQGGIYENVEPGRMVSEFENWAMDPARKAGDTTIVQSQFGYHIMYFSSRGDTPLWQTEADKGIANDATVKWRDEIVEAATLKAGGLGMKFVGKSGFMDILFGKSYNLASHNH